jgi:hypothetical protein
VSAIRCVWPSYMIVLCSNIAPGVRHFDPLHEEFLTILHPFLSSEVSGHQSSEKVYGRFPDLPVEVPNDNLVSSAINTALASVSNLAQPRPCIFVLALRIRSSRMSCMYPDSESESVPPTLTLIAPHVFIPHLSLIHST